MLELSIASAMGPKGGFQQAQGDSLITSYILELQLNVCITTFTICFSIY